MLRNKNPMAPSHTQSSQRAGPILGDSPTPTAGPRRTVKGHHTLAQVASAPQWPVSHQLHIGGQSDPRGQVQ